MKVIDAVQTRRAVKHFNANIKMTEEEVTTLMSSVILSPTSYNIQNWRFVRVTDTQKREALLEAAWGQRQIVDAAEVFIFCANNQAWEQNPERYYANTSEDVKNTLLPMLQNFYQGKEHLQKEEGFRSCGIAAQTMMLMAKSMGYDSCPMIGFNPQQVATLINLPENHTITMIVTIGKAAKPAYPRGGQLPLSEVMVENSF